MIVRLFTVVVVLGAVIMPASPAQAAGEDLVPAGVIHNVFAGKPIVYIVGADPDLAAYVQKVRARFQPDARILTGDEALAADLAAVNLIVYGTPGDNAWLAHFADRFPVRVGDGEILLQDRRITGDHLRAIFAVRNPHDRSRRALVYIAAAAADVVGINGLFHGPTEWLVADGGQVLDSGSFHVTGPVAPEVMATDLEFLIAAVTEVHPATVDGVSADLQQAIDRARAAIAEPLTRDEFWRVTNGVLIALHDAHTRMAPLMSGESVALPLDWLADGLVVDLDTDLLARGDRVLSIGGLDEDELLAGLTGLIPAETAWWVRAMSEHVLPSSGILVTLGAAVSDVVVVRVERGGKVLTLELPVGESVPEQQGRPWARYEIDREHDLGVFTLDRCQVDDFYLERLRSFFDEVHAVGIGRIAVDVRANSGGNSRVVDEFLRYLPVERYRDFSGGVRVSQQARAQGRGGDSELGYHEFPATEMVNDHVADLPPFTGEVFVLTSKLTFSSGNWFAVVFHDNDLGTIVGEPTGNAPSSYGELLRFELPETALSFHMSCKRWVRPDPSRDPASCLEPDELIVLTREDVAAGRDPVVEALRGR